MLFTSKEYLLFSEKRIAYLQKIVAGRPVVILAAGPSIRELEQRIKELRDADICYFGLNNFFVQETHILRQINKHFSAVTCSGREGMKQAISAIIDFLNRDADNMFISSLVNDSFGLLGNDFDAGWFMSNYDKKLLFFSLGSGKTFPNRDYPLHFIKSNSLLILIQMALIGKASSVVLFGADGHCGKDPKEYYYRQNEYELQKWPQVDLCLVQDTKLFFNNIAAKAVMNTCKTYGLPLVNILNCSEKSFYTPFPKVTYDDAFDYLIKGRKIFTNLDLRVARKPKMPNLCLLTAEKAVNFWKKHKWGSFKIIINRIRCRLMKIPNNK